MRELTKLERFLIAFRDKAILLGLVLQAVLLGAQTKSGRRRRSPLPVPSIVVELVFLASSPVHRARDRSVSLHTGMADALQVELCGGRNLRLAHLLGVEQLAVGKAWPCPAF